ncbi:hypothetical protein B0H11DRAFT_1989771 [Mycena galericulata]|nr:hypothetical protein B0H11DRAFT_1989771 [Mycena galericulata]
MLFLVTISCSTLFNTISARPKPQFPTPLPSIPGLVKILITSKPVANQTLYGMSLSEILDFRDVPEDAPNSVPHNSPERSLLTIKIRCSCAFLAVCSCSGIVYISASLLISAVSQTRCLEGLVCVDVVELAW